MELSSARVLVVEDHPIIALGLSNELVELGATVVGTAHTLSDALHQASESDFNVAFVDINLGNVVAYPLGEVLRRQNIPFIVVSGLPRPGEPEMFYTAPRLLKPFKSDELRAAIEAIDVDRKHQ